MNHIKYFIHDALCLDIIDDKTISEIFIKENNTTCLSYNNFFNQKRLISIIKINHIYRIIFKKECPVLLISEVVNLNDINNTNTIIKYLIEGSFKKYILAKEALDQIKDESDKINALVNAYDSSRIKIEISDILEKRHDIKLDRKKDFLESYKDGIQSKYDKNVKEYFKSNYSEITTCLKNSFNDSIMIFNVSNKLNHYSTLKDYEKYIVHNDRCFQRMLYNNDAIYIDETTPNSIIIPFLCQSNKNAKTPIIFTKNNFVLDNEFVKYSFNHYYVKNTGYMEMIPADLIQNFINTVEENTCNIAIKNIKILNNTVDFGPILGGQKSINLSRIDEKYHTYIIDIFLNLLFKKQYSHLNGIYNLIKYVVKYNLLADKNSISTENNNNDNIGINDNKKCILITDNRENIMNVINLHISLNNLIFSQWDFVFIGSEKSIKFMKENSIQNLNTTYIHDSRLDKDLFNIEVYNDIMKDNDVWVKIGEKYDYCLLIQDDSSIMKKGFESSEFIKCDYVGSPWVNHECNKEIVDLCGHLCGNGGFSYRNIETMKKVTEQFKDYKKELFNNNLQYIPEDVYFSRYVPKVGGHIPYNTSFSFGSEQVLKMGSFGFHKLWAYNSIEKVDEFFSYY